MPSVSRFLGIIIYFYYQDHNPPHFHAIYGNNEAQILIKDLSVEAGFLPPRVLGLVIEWADMYKKELEENWQLAKEGKPLKQIQPLV